MDTLERCGIVSEIGYHVGDNTNSNDTCLPHVSLRVGRDYGVRSDAFLIVEVKLT